MLMIKDALKINVSIVLKLNNFITGSTITDYRGMHIASADGFQRPITKPDGYIVFTGTRPDAVRITSDRYHDALVKTENHDGTVLRLSLIPRESIGNHIISEGEAHIGFDCAAYTLSSPISTDKPEICLFKNDLNDLTDMFHALVTPSGESEIVYITKNNGNGAFALKAEVKHEYPMRGTRLIPLARVFGTDGKIPFPRDAKTAYIISDGLLRMEVLA